MRNFRIASKRKWLVIVFVVAFTGGGIRRVEAQESALAGRDISLAVVEDDGLKATAKDVVFTPRPVLNVERHIVKPDEKVAQLLRANGILSDAEAFGLVYDLNPTLKNVKAVTPGTVLMLPTVRSGQTPRPANQLVALVVDTSMKKELLAKFDALDNAIATVNGFGVERFNSADERRATLTSLKEIKDSLGVIDDVIRGRVRPINAEVLGQLNAEAELLQAKLENLTQPNRKPRVEDLATINLVGADLKVKRRTLTDVRAPGELPARWREVLVVVRTLGQDGGQVPNLRVYYVPEALRGRAQFIKSFDTLSSPSQRSMPEANYLIWAGRPGQDAETAALSDIKRLSLRKTSDEPLPLDLSIIR